MPSLKRRAAPGFSTTAVPILAAALLAVLSFDAVAADLPKSTQAFLTQLKLPASTMDGIDQELTVPQAWLDGARKQGLVRISGIEEPALQAQMIKPFLERYPFIKVDFQRGSANERVVRPLLAFREGRYLMDVVQSMNSAMGEFLKLDAAADITDLPVFNNVLPGAHDAKGIAIGFRAKAHCMSYNTDLIKREQLPKTWADLPNTPILANGRVGAVMLPHLWFMPLWGKFGEARATQYLDDFFVKLKPQIRREGLNAAMGLVGAGENYVSVPAYAERIKELQDKGAPIAFYCADMVPMEMPKVAIFKGTPNIDAAKIYVNWLVSKEGQIAQMAVLSSQSVHKDLQSAKFVVFPEEIEGKEIISFDDQPTTDRFLEMWNKYAAGGK